MAGLIALQWLASAAEPDGRNLISSVVAGTVPLVGPVVLTAAGAYGLLATR
jgi:hypothetical protein